MGGAHHATHPGFNDDDAQLHAECTWIREHLGPDVPLHFSAFHPSYRMMDVPPTPHETLTRARDIALEEDSIMCTQATCMIVKAIPRIAQTLNAGPSSWNAIGIESLPIVYLPDTVAMGTARMQDCYRRTLVICLRSPARFTADRQYARQSSSSI